MKGDLSSSFANDYYESKEIGKDWERFAEEKGYLKYLKIEIEDEWTSFSKNIKNKVEEFLEDLQMELQYSQMKNFHTADTTDYRFWFNLGMGGLAILNFWNPIGWLFAATTIVGLLGNWLLKSKEKRIQEAKKNVIDGILPQIDQQEKSIKQKVQNTFIENISKVQKNINEKLDHMIIGLTDIKNILKDIENESSIIQNSLNKVFVFRILEHLGKMKIDVKEEALIQYINMNLETTQIDRNYQKSYLNIKTDFDISSNEEKEIQEITQTNVKFLK